MPKRETGSTSVLGAATPPFFSASKALMRALVSASASPLRRGPVKSIQMRPPRPRRRIWRTISGTAARLRPRAKRAGSLPPVSRLALSTSTAVKARVRSIVKRPPPAMGTSVCKAASKAASMRSISSSSASRGSPGQPCHGVASSSRRGHGPCGARPS